MINHKRTERIYKEERLSLRRRKRRRKASVIRIKPDTPTAPNQKWSMDFVHDQLAGGRRLRCLNIVDDYTRECNEDQPNDEPISPTTHLSNH